MLYFGTRKFHKFYGCFQLLQMNCSSAVSSLSNGVSSTENTPHWEPFGRYIFTSRKLYHQPWGHTKKSHGLTHTTSVSSCYTCLYSPLIIQSSFHIHADSEDLQYGLGRGWGTKWEAISWTCMALAQWQGPGYVLVQNLMCHHSAGGYVQYNTLVMETLNAQLLPQKCPGAVQFRVLGI